MLTRRLATLTMTATLAALAQLALVAPAAAQLPDETICRDEEALAAADRVTQGACIALHRRKGYCNACHVIDGVSSGNIAPPLRSITKRFPDTNRLRAHVEDARRYNPDTVMPPFGPHGILTPEEIDKVMEFLLAL